MVLSFFVPFALMQNRRFDVVKWTEKIKAKTNGPPRVSLNA